MPRAIWSGAISFGLVNVPVKLYSAVSRKSVRFHQLDESSGVRIQQKRVNPQTGEEVPYEQIVRGYEISPEQYVVITPDELWAGRCAAPPDVAEFPAGFGHNRALPSVTTARTRLVKMEGLEPTWLPITTARGRQTTS